ncbi:MAG: biopolymer transporter ExbD [Paracoccaceae bacterium]|nr:biopolymer transporter ExbD [Paracoccaceae bacterium]
MTSLIDVIFLLLLFFMLSSTFSKFGEVELRVGSGVGGDVQLDDMVFVRLEEERLSLNGVPLGMPLLVAQLSQQAAQTVVVSVRPSVTAQRMTDLLVALRAATEARVILLGDRS